MFYSSLILGSWKQPSFSVRLKPKVFCMAVLDFKLKLAKFYCYFYFHGTQDLTIWTNELLQSQGRQLPQDLRNAISDGFTLPSIIEIVCKSELYVEIIL